MAGWFSSTRRVLLAAGLLAVNACGGGGGSREPLFQFISPFDDGDDGIRQGDARATITTNNGAQPLLFIQGRVLNGVDNNIVSYRLVNGIGTLPLAGAYPLVVGAGGAFDLVLADPLRHALSPMEPEADNVFTFSATNEFSPVGPDGVPVPSEGRVTLAVRNGVRFTSPVYAARDGGVIDTACAFNATTGITGSFGTPSEIAGNATLYRVDEADLAAPIDPANPPGTAAPFSFNGSTGDFTITFDSGELAAAGFTAGQSGDNNFFIVFDSSDPDQLPAPGLVATLPFLACDVTP
ncbi:MAG: hypothetical protein KIT79_04020 [Deltaproteobacteria bacterium]|nr:hypothetical protein [Deltaproteobacteria bacterium]